MLSPRNPFKIGDLEKMLPHGMYLHKKYNSQKFHAIARLKQSNVYVQRKNILEDQQEKIKAHRRNQQTEMLQ